jgi:hypothetical protein
MERRFILLAALAISNCTNTSKNNTINRLRPETVAVEYVERKFGGSYFDPRAKGYNINVRECGERWCVSLNSPLDPKTGALPFQIGGGAEIELRKSDLAVMKATFQQ